MFAVAGNDKTVKVWSTGGVAQAALRGHGGAVLCVGYDPTGDWLLSGGGDATVQIWNTRTGRSQHLLRGHTDKVLDVAFAQDGSKAVRSWLSL